MPTIATLTMNPTVDAGYEIDRLEPTHKLRSHAEHYAPGGGGINVARVFKRLGGHAECHYLCGGATGIALDALIDGLGIERRPMRIAGSTRIACNVVERATGKEYRFVPEGPHVAEGEWRAGLAQFTAAHCDYIVASGSLPPGVPSDFYAHVAATAAREGTPFVLDSSGDALREGLGGARVYLVKPSQGELAHLAGRELPDAAAVEHAAMELVRDGRAEIVAVTMGSQGGVLATAQGAQFLPAIAVEAKSAVGAGDSFLAAMIHALADGRDALDAFRFGMAAGSAAVLTAGTDLAQASDIKRLYAAEIAAGSASA